MWSLLLLLPFCRGSLLYQADYDMKCRVRSREAVSLLGAQFEYRVELDHQALQGDLDLANGSLDLAKGGLDLANGGLDFLKVGHDRCQSSI